LIYDIYVHWIDAEDYSDGDDDTRAPVIDDQVQSKSRFGFLEKEVLLDFFNGFKIQCQVPRCGCFFENIEVHDWCMCYSIYFRCGMDTSTHGKRGNPN
jgi:hypothetical protein